MVLGGWAFGSCLGHESGDLVNGISTLIKKTPQSSLVPLIEFSVRAPLLFHCTEDQDALHCSYRGRKKSFSFILSGSVAEALQLKLTKENSLFICAVCIYMSETQ